MQHAPHPAPPPASLPPLPERAATGTVTGYDVGLFAATTFASAFLIFLVQPLVGKRILPWFGGVPSVWAVCLAFYQTALFAGYAYAHVLSRRARPALQVAVHAAVVGVAVLALPVLPGEAWKPAGTGDPIAEIAAMLVANVALPFLVLAATGPLVAVWFARRHPSRSPYPLYAVSNLGSLVALLAYPFALEPRLPLSATGELWSGAFAATGVAVIACAALSWRAAPDAPTPTIDSAPRDEPSPGRIALWCLLAACAVVVLMGVTNQLCLDVASVPFLWIVPLAIYLSSLILCFGSARAYRRPVYAVLAVLAYAAPLLVDRFGVREAVVGALGGAVPFQVTRYGILLFAVCMVMHGELYRLRPHAGSLSLFYLCTSGGGALGGLAVGLVAPRVFDDFYELPLGLSMAAVLLLAACRRDTRGWLRPGAPPWRWAPATGLAAFASFYLLSPAFERAPYVLHQERSFFGVLHVERRPQAKGTQRVLRHGTTMHGIQVEGSEGEPTSYYGVHTGIGIALRMRPPDVPSEIGVIGLGTGTLAAYGRAGDRMRFFEIDPAVIRLARSDRYFTYLAKSPAEIEVIPGDGRISLVRERARGAPLFDWLIVDAYSSDSVPVHLLTREALALYLDSLAPQGMLAVHVSSRYFNLVPILARLAQDAGIHAVGLLNSNVPAQYSSASLWVFLCRDEAPLDALAKAAVRRRRALGLRQPEAAVRRPSPKVIADAPLWTDDYSDLVRALSARGSRQAS